MFKLSMKAMIVAATLALASSAQAVTVNYTLDSGWTRFGAGLVGTTTNRQYSFTLTRNAIMTIVDGYLAGDQYEVFANGSSLGATSVPGTGGTNTGMNFDAAAADGIHSVGRFILGPGTYFITLTVLARTGTGTRLHTGAFRADVGQVPVPAAGALLMTALGAMALRRRRRPV
ncbi:MAG: VPLPA-CTERM sorting domain-containing protein [Albidovulum sp.]